MGIGQVETPRLNVELLHEQRSGETIACLPSTDLQSDRTKESPKATAL